MQRKMLGYNWERENIRCSVSHVQTPNRGEGQEEREALTSLLTSVKTD